MTLTVLISNIIVALVSAGGFWTLIEHTFEKRRKSKDEKIDQLIKDVAEIKKELDSTAELSLSFSRERLNHLTEKYMALGYIPKYGIISYKLLGQAYTDAGGNSEVRTKFEWAIENLEVK